MKKKKSDLTVTGAKNAVYAAAQKGHENAQEELEKEFYVLLNKTTVVCDVMERYSLEIGQVLKKMHRYDHADKKNVDAMCNNLKQMTKRTVERYLKNAPGWHEPHGDLCDFATDIMDETVFIVGEENRIKAVSSLKLLRKK